MPPLADFADQLDEIFFTSSATQNFAGEAARSTFRERWLGRYLDHDREWFYVAVRGDRLAGYLAGAIEDPARTARFSDIDYFKVIAEETAKYPAHFHVNVAEGARSGGIGSRLIATFIADLRRAGVGGVHLVTGHNSRNIPFYLRNGFKLRKVIKGVAGDSVMLARSVLQG
ncbi:MAG: GNAT family N-acetyltransferase [Alphaproteobacteria bacterium]|nr:GNAT family N-acetyltransferase [Alphaproteobacteria bacterium]